MPSGERMFTAVSRVKTDRVTPDGIANGNDQREKRTSRTRRTRRRRRQQIWLLSSILLKASRTQNTIAAMGQPRTCLSATRERVGERAVTNAPTVPALKQAKVTRNKSTIKVESMIIAVDAKAGLELRPQGCFSKAARMPSKIDRGSGGQPCTTASTGKIADTGPTTP